MSRYIWLGKFYYLIIKFKFVEMEILVFLNRRNFIDVLFENVYLASNNFDSTCF